MALQQHVADAGNRSLCCIEAEDVGRSARYAFGRNGHEVFAGEGFEEVLQPAVGGVTLFEERIEAYHVARAPFRILPCG